MVGTSEKVIAVVYASLDNARRHVDTRCRREGGREGMGAVGQQFLHSDFDSEHWNMR